MTVEMAIRQVQEEYEKAKGLGFVRNPLAYALYQVWKMVDEKTMPTDTNPKCGNCAYAIPTHAFGSDTSYIECTNRGNLQNKTGLAHIKQRTTKACKRYKYKENEK